MCCSLLTQYQQYYSIYYSIPKHIIIFFLLELLHILGNWMEISVFYPEKWKRKLNGFTKNFFLWRSFPIHISNTYYFILLLLTFPSFYLSLWSSYQVIISFHRTTYRSNNNISKSSTQTVSFVVFWVATHASWFILLFSSIVAYFNIIISIQRTFSLCIATQVFYQKSVDAWLHM